MHFKAAGPRAPEVARSKAFRGAGTAGAATDWKYRFQKFDTLSIKGDANASFSNPSGRRLRPGRPGTTDESIDNKGVSAVRSARADKWLVLARNLL
jgi:hypothetical protein